jgi:hypothetical protein
LPGTAVLPGTVYTIRKRVGAERMGYGDYFALTFLLSLPSLALLPWLKPWIHETP